jgi:hypothetical protein
MQLSTAGAHKAEHARQSVGERDEQRHRRQ